MAAKYKKTVIPISGGKIALYASPKVSAAVASVTKDMNLFRGVKFAQIIEAVYEQGKKDGARAAFDAVEKKVLEATTLVPHRPPRHAKKGP